MTDGRARLDGQPLVLRADASTADGTGHMMRTLALSQAWLDAGGRATWLVAEAPSALLERIANEGIEVAPVAAPAGSPADAALVREALARESRAVAVIDGLQFDSAYLEALGDVGDRVLLIADEADRQTYPVGYLLNQNAHADRAAYPADASCRFLLGTRYTVLRREFAAPPPTRATPQVVRHLLVTFGGSDPTGMTARTLAALRRLPEKLRGPLQVRVIVGAANRDAARIDAAVADPDLGYRATVERAVDDMPARMTWADLAVTSGGSTVWELARMGCPALVVETVPVEEALVSGLARIGLFGRLGPAAQLDERDMADEIATKAEDMAWRADMTELGMRVIDGRGARRVVAALTAERDTSEERT